MARYYDLGILLVVKKKTKNSHNSGLFMKSINYSMKSISKYWFCADFVTFSCCVDVIRASNILGSLDSKYLVKLKSYLNPVLQSSSRSRFVRCWRAKTDGWAASTFHSNCDGKGPTVTVIKVGSYIFGGYTDVSWSSPSEYQFISLLFYSGVNVERSDLRIHCSPRQMCTNKFACLV